MAFGWAHAFQTPGDPGQHNDSINQAPGLPAGDTVAGAGSNNTANMFTAVYKHQIMPHLVWYTNVAATLNGSAAHYDLGAGGHGVTTDCHDGSGANGGIGAAGVDGPHCWTGGTLMGVSTGLDFSF